MTPAPRPPNEVARLAELKSLALLDTKPEERFDRYTRIACRVFGVPYAMVTLIDEERQWFKSNQGVPFSESPRETSFCAYAILNEKIMIVEDTLKDNRFKDSPVVAAPNGIRFYAGYPLTTHKGFRIGTLCIADISPRTLSDTDKQLLEDLANMVEEEFSIQSIATIDELTGLSNRRGFLGMAEHAIALCRRLDKTATLMFFDLDGFKSVNDNHGHAEGDTVLKNIGKLLLSVFRNSDVVARMGGDEFCILLTGTDAEQVNRPLQNLEEAINLQNRHTPYEIGYSVGIVAFDPDAHPSVNAFVQHADKLMYEQKRKGKTPRNGKLSNGKLSKGELNK